jgi:GH15 family glucan-1,4-alpha-glucosidase
MEWLIARDTIYEDIMQKAWNKDLQFFSQSYEDLDVVDSAVLVMPLVFFVPAVSAFDQVRRRAGLLIVIDRRNRGS